MGYYAQTVPSIPNLISKPRNSHHLSLNLSGGGGVCCVCFAVVYPLFCSTHINQFISKFCFEIALSTATLRDMLSFPLQCLVFVA